MKYLFVFLILTLTLAACMPGQTTSPETTSAPPQADVELNQASLIELLRAGGATVELGDSVEQVFFTAPGQVIKINGGELQVYEYASSAAMEADASQVDPDGSSIGTTMVTWIAPPHFYKSGQVIVLYLGDDPTVLALLTGLFGEQFAGR